MGAHTLGNHLGNPRSLKAGPQAHECHQPERYTKTPPERKMADSQAVMDEEAPTPSVGSGTRVWPVWNGL